MNYREKKFVWLFLNGAKGTRRYVPLQGCEWQSFIQQTFLLHLPQRQNSWWVGPSALGIYLLGLNPGSAAFQLWDLRQATSLGSSALISSWVKGESIRTHLGSLVWGLSESGCMDLSTLVRAYRSSNTKYKKCAAFPAVSLLWPPLSMTLECHRGGNVTGEGASGSQQPRHSLTSQWLGFKWEAANTYYRVICGHHLDHICFHANTCSKMIVLDHLAGQVKP